MALENSASMRSGSPQPGTFVTVCFAIAFGAAGCGDPLAATWSTTTFPGGTMPSDVASYEQDLTFGSDHTLDMTIIVRIPTTAAVFAGCTETCELTGLTWMDAQPNGISTLAVAGTAVKTATRDGCASSADDHPRAPATSTECPAGMPGGAYTYTIHDDTLEITDSSGAPTTYARVRH